VRNAPHPSMRLRERCLPRRPQARQRFGRRPRRDASARR
jgi:hypothetical protein